MMPNFKWLESLPGKQLHCMFFCFPALYMRFAVVFKGKYNVCSSKKHAVDCTINNFDTSLSLKKKRKMCAKHAKYSRGFKSRYWKAQIC